MSTHKSIDRIICVIMALALLLTVLFMCGKSLGLQEVTRTLGYEDKLFDQSLVHTLEIEMDGWESFLATATQEEYAACSITVDGEKFSNAAIRAKGNTSLTNVQNYGNNRYSFKVEFDHYDGKSSYHGLDKLSLNNIIQDNTYVKDYLVYTLMQKMGVDAPLVSFTYITVNGEDWGLYLAVEGVEDAFLERNYGDNYGDLYKPDSISMGGGRGNGRDFNMEDFDFEDFDFEDIDFEDIDFGDLDPELPDTENIDLTKPDSASLPGGKGGFGGFGGNMDPTNIGGGGFSMGSSDVSLIYSDDSVSSYSNIFNNAKTDVTGKDQERLIASLKKLNEQTDLEEVVNIDEVIRYFVVHNFAVNFDSYTGSMIHNYYLYEEDGRLSMIPWDYNLAFGGFQSSGSAESLVNYPIDTPVSGGTVDSRPMLSWIFSSEEYTGAYHEVFAEFIASVFASGEFAEMMDSLKTMISPYVEKDPTAFCTYDEFDKGFDTLKEFCLLRAESISGQLEGRIPSTSEGQSADSSSLIEANDITVSDMGSMGGGMGGNMGGDMGGNTGGDMGDKIDGGMDRRESAPTGQESPNETQESTAAEPGSMPAGQGDMPAGQGDMPAGQGNMPAGQGNMPAGQGNMPAGQGNMPAGQGNMPAGQGNMPGGQGVTPSVPAGTDSGELPTMPGGTDSGELPTMPGENSGTGGSTSSSSASVWLLLGASLAVLAGGLLAAGLYKKKN